MKKIKIVIWDLDDTFWSGTLSEGKVDQIDDNIKLVKHLTDIGIMNSISSKNDFQVAKNKLQEMGVWDYFIFPHINWEPKGQQVKQLLKDCSLRVENALFVDDNEMNLQEVEFYNPGINIVNSQDRKSMSELWTIVGKEDQEHERLKQYKILEIKNRDSKSFFSNEEFLYSSDISVEICEDCENHSERLIDLINRSNQLNYTKIRVDENDFNKLLKEKDRKNGYVKVFDNYGDYGIVGFFSIKNGNAEHFLFSCRTIGMGIEQYVYAKLGFPHITVKGEVRSELDNHTIPRWINNNKTNSSKQINKEIRGKINILISGGCDLEQFAAYLKSGNSKIEYRFNNGIVRHDNTYYWIGANSYSDEVKKEMINNLPFIKELTFDRSIYDSNYNIVVLSLLMDYTQALYRNKKNPNIIIAHGNFDRPITLDSIPDYMTREEVEYLVNNYDFIGGISNDNLKRNLDIIRNSINPDTTLIIINGCEVPVENNLEIDRYIKHQEYNKIVDDFVSLHDNTYLLDVRKIVMERKQLSDNIRHYNREVYYSMANEFVSLINQICNTELSSSKKKSFLWGIKWKYYRLKEKQKWKR